MERGLNESRKYYEKHYYIIYINYKVAFQTMGFPVLYYLH